MSITSQIRMHIWKPLAKTLLKFYIRLLDCKLLVKILSKRYILGANYTELLPKLKVLKQRHAWNPISKEQKAQVESRWGWVKHLAAKSIDYRYYGVYNSLGMFNPDMISDDIYVAYVLRTLNPIIPSMAFKNKGVYDVVFHDLRRPKTIVKCVNNVIYDSECNVISLDQAIDILTQHPKAIIKCTIGRSNGDDIAVFSPADTPAADLKALIQDYFPYFIVQQVIEQSEATRRFNPSSLNTFRVCTLNINGVASVVNILFRHGRNGAVIDNGAKGGVCCGVNLDGSFKGLAFDSSLNKYDTTPFGISYSEVVIPEVQKICETAINAHKSILPMIGFCGWDFAIDPDGNPVFIEANLGWPGIVLEQIVNNAPLFGDRTAELCEYLASADNRISWRTFLFPWI